MDAQLSYALRQAATIPSLRLDIEKKCLKNHLNRFEIERKIVDIWCSRSTFEFLGGPLGAPGRPPWRQDGLRCELGGIWVHLDACWGASWRQDGPSRSQDGAMLSNFCQYGELAAYLAHLGDFFGFLGAIFPKWAKTKSMRWSAGGGGRGPVQFYRLETPDSNFSWNWRH